MDYKGYIVYRYLNLNGEVIYVGKTDNLKRRFNEHKSEDMYKECYKVEYIELDNPADIEIYETYYINKYKPKCNSSKDMKCYQTAIVQKIAKMFHSLELLSRNTLDEVSARCILRGILDNITTYSFIYQREFVLLHNKSQYNGK